MFCWVPWTVSGLPISYSRPLQTLSETDHLWYTLPFTQHRKEKKNRNWIGFLFIWTIIESSSAHLIVCGKKVGGGDFSFGQDDWIDTDKRTRFIQEHPPSYANIYIYIYIYCHPQTDCFVLLEVFSVARHAGRSKPGSKPVQLYVRLSLRSLGHQADHVG